MQATESEQQRGKGQTRKESWRERTGEIQVWRTEWASGLEKGINQRERVKNERRRTGDLERGNKEKSGRKVLNGSKERKHVVLKPSGSRIASCQLDFFAWQRSLFMPLHLLAVGVWAWRQVSYSQVLAGLRLGDVLWRMCSGDLSVRSRIFGFLDRPSFTHSSYTHAVASRAEGASACPCPHTQMSRSLLSSWSPWILGTAVETADYNSLWRHPVYALTGWWPNLPRDSCSFWDHIWRKLLWTLFS